MNHRTRHFGRATRATASGQAIVEFLVALTFVMGILFIALIMLAKFNDVRTRTLMGSRYVAWERTVWQSDADQADQAEDAATWQTVAGDANQPAKSDDDLHAEILQRTLSGDGNRLSGADRSNSGFTGTPVMWRDYSGALLTQNPSSVSVSTAMSGDPSVGVETFTNQSFGSVQTAGHGAYNATIALPTHNFASSAVSINVAGGSDMLKRLWPGFNGLTFSDSSSLVTNTWLPQGSAQSRAVFATAAPASQSTLIDGVDYASLHRYAPEIDRLEMGRIRQDVVPSNRLYTEPGR